ncbi:SOS response-associated peptidase [Tsuneonella sp. YG55]|uniref:Abasic site processing protein n=1 Tax=Tsuneonella litorea TaxID=2976475 RepID=A0A9X2W2V7_9SPHN|nr:SOS response-associated peptidase [Tsuneonella litorea]MCT2559821.1 SOS response-associated peptidase [Tsuneonella litorea]
MCNLYRMTKNADEVAKWFDAINDAAGANFAEELYPGYPGLVVAEGRVRQMHWGFPVVLKGKRGQPLKPKPVTNARDDKLTTAFWRDSFARRRCLIPVTQWAEAEGKPGQMTRTWYSLAGHELFAVAGLWRPTAEWGHSYAMVMADACSQMVDVHDRMPVILTPAQWPGWLGGDESEALALARTCDLALAVDRTDALWVTGERPAQKPLL